MLSQRPTLRASWIGYAIANHLLEENDAAYSILDEFKKVLIANIFVPKFVSKIFTG